MEQLGMQKPWLKSYPKGTATEIDPNQFNSVGELVFTNFAIATPLSIWGPPSPLKT
jgi:hypothetical protein